MSYLGHADQRFGSITYSHCGEDLMVANIFNLIGIKKPTYLDIGAHHPFDISNTALLYQLGSRGVNIEANPKLMPAFLQHRPDDLNVNIGVATKAGKMKFYMWDDRSGRNTFSEDWSKKLEVMTEVILLDVIPLAQVVDQYCGGKYPDFMSIDIEGLDYDVLRTADFSKSQPKVICAEVLPKDSDEFCSMMSSKGYYKHSRHSVDLIFVLNEYREKVT